MMPSLDLRAADPEVEIRRPEARDKEYMSRRIYLRDKDFEEIGRTAGCVSRRCAVPLGRRKPLDPVKVLAAREKALMELECICVGSKRPIGAQWMDVD